jgi:hypothetical protein
VSDGYHPSSLNISKSSILLQMKGVRSAYHELDNVDTEMFVNHCAQAYAGPREPVKNSMIGRIDDEFNVGLDMSVRIKPILQNTSSLTYVDL